MSHGQFFTIRLSVWFEPRYQYGADFKRWRHALDKTRTYADVNIGDIVSLYSPEQLWIAHRVIQLEHLLRGDYLLETKGDANWLTEVWEISADETVPVVVARIRFGGYAMDYLASAPVRILLSIAMVTLVVILVQRWRISHLEKGKE